MNSSKAAAAAGSLFLSAALAIAGCTPETARWSADEAPKTNQVEFVRLTHTVRFAPDASALAGGEERALERFLSGDEARAGDLAWIELPVAAGALASRRRASIARVLAKLHVAAVDFAPPGSGPSTGETAPPRDSATVLVGRYVVTPPRCPDWTKPEADDYTNTPPSNFGCATTANIGLMVANPADLVRGGGSGAVDSTFAQHSVERYRAGEVAHSLAPSPEGAGADGHGGLGNGVSGGGSSGGGSGASGAAPTGGGPS